MLSMKKILFSVCLLAPTLAMAQQMSEQDMQKMMAQIQEMTACMQNIDQNEIKALEQDSKQFESVVKGLCNEGKRDQAQQQAIEFSEKVMKAPALVTMRECTEKMNASMKGMMPNMDPEEIAKDYSNGHVCDEI